MTAKKPTIYNKEEIYKKEIVPLIDQIKKIAGLNDLPFFICVAIANTEKHTTYRYDGVLTGYLGFNLADDQFKKHLCVANGFDVKAPNSSMDFDKVTDFLAETTNNDSSVEEIPPEMG